MKIHKLCMYPKMNGFISIYNHLKKNLIHFGFKINKILMNKEIKEILLFNYSI